MASQPVRKGKLIVFEGLDGSGKSTQLHNLKERLSALRIPNILTREPSDTNIIGLITRGAINGTLDIDRESLAFLFAADRYEHVTKEIIPNLEKGITVLCDRYYFSNFAYQGFGTSIERLIEYNEKVMSLLRPDVTVFLDTTAEECVRRINDTRHQHIEMFEDLANLTAVRSNFFRAFEMLNESENIIVFETDGLTEARVAEQVWIRLMPLFFDEKGSRR